MNLFLRLLYTFITGFFKKKIDYLTPSIIKFRVWPFDLDFNGHMTNSRYLSIMDLARIDYMIKTGFLKKIRRLKITPVLGSSTIRWRQSLKCFQLFIVETRMLGWDDKWMYVQQRLIRNNQIISDAIVKGIFIGTQGSISMKDINTLIAPGLVSPPLSDKIKLWMQCEEAMRKNVIKDFTQIDEHQK